MIDFKTVFSVSQFARSLNDHLRTEFGAVRIEGEVAAFTRATSGHWYFTLKDSTAQLRLVMFRQKNVLAGFFPGVGDKVEVLAQLGMYEPRGELQLIVDVIKKAGQGNLHEQFLQLKAKLAAQGLFDLARKKVLPKVVFNLGVITSLQAAALADVKQALARRAPHIRYRVYHTAVQGEQAIGQIIEALGHADSAGHDALILCRGGGSLEDLWCFNEEPVVRAVAACVTPIVVGVGHESDVTLAEFAADLRAATPTAAAELVSVPTRDLQLQLDALARRLNRGVLHRLELLAQQIDRAELGLLTPTGYVDALQARLYSAAGRLPMAAQRQFNYLNQRCDGAAERLNQESRRAQQIGQLQTERAIQALQRALRQRISQASMAVDRLSGVVEAVSPQKTLDRGYAYLRASSQGRPVVRSVDQMAPGDTLTAAVSDGELVLNVLDKTQGKRLLDS